jgi:hypothetical protein
MDLTSSLTSHTLPYTPQPVLLPLEDGLFPLHSPLLRESQLVSFPPLTDMLKFGAGVQRQVPDACLGLHAAGVAVGICGCDVVQLAEAFTGRFELRVAVGLDRASVADSCERQASDEQAKFLELHVFLRFVLLE